MTPEAIIKRLNARISELKFQKPVAYVYNPLEYALGPHLAYWERYGRGPKRAVFLGMNPGPWGMAQTGIPFGDLGMVKGWLGIEGLVGRPDPEHPKRKVEGFKVKRGEVSGQRLWGWAAGRFQTPERFFSEFFVVNYCPLMFLDEGGRNVTPDKLGKEISRELNGACDEALVSFTRLLDAKAVIGVGAWAAGRAREALSALPVAVGKITHPSPANPAANRGWAEVAERELKAMGYID